MGLWSVGVKTTMILKGSPLWSRIDKLCWEGYSKVLKYSNNDIEGLINNFKGTEEEWYLLIDKVTKDESR